VKVKSLFDERVERQETTNMRVVCVKDPSSLS
jgi:hypothetical protein